MNCTQPAVWTAGARVAEEHPMAADSLALHLVGERLGAACFCFRHLVCLSIWRCSEARRGECSESRSKRFISSRDHGAWLSSRLYRKPSEHPHIHPETFHNPAANLSEYIPFVRGGPERFFLAPAGSP